MININTKFFEMVILFDIPDVYDMRKPQQSASGRAVRENKKSQVGSLFFCIYLAGIGMR